MGGVKSSLLYSRRPRSRAGALLMPRTCWAAVLKASFKMTRASSMSAYVAVLWVKRICVKGQPEMEEVEVLRGSAMKFTYSEAQQLDAVRALGIGCMLGSGNGDDPALETLAALGEREVLPEAGDVRGDILGGKEVAEVEIEAELLVLGSHLGGAGDRETRDGEEWERKGKRR
ncbi:hypothetical protein CCHR01_17784 [Colletotrichum chrysophilum]|uniref:Uncharacterized protein n=1 Tax=Colletotrichum chrysophilum TaxID=1836956 RepID=A0AAD9A1I1_9PEZI|nr:hypothetical protein CCHR01_17784 [Colletotrichum chrysophilum]